VTTLRPAPATPRATSGPNLGLALAIVSAAAFGLSGSLAKSLLEIGWSPGAVVLARIGGAFFALLVPVVLLLRTTGQPSGRQARRMVAYGMVAVALAQLCFFSAVQYLSVGVALLLEYLAPVLLIGWHWWLRRTPPATGVFVGAGVAMAGMVLVLDVVRGLVLNPIGVLWGLGAALCLCGYFVLSESGNDHPIAPLLMTAAGTGVGAVVVVLAGVSGLLPLTVELRGTALAGATVAWWVPVLLLVGISAVLAYLTGIVAVRRLGSSVASFVALAEVIFAVAFAIVLLGQQPSAGQLVGGLLVLTGIAVVQRQSGSTRSGAAQDQRAG
jgi:drug/metabolite transporter (DMT)-like permease